MENSVQLEGGIGTGTDFTAGSYCGWVEPAGCWMCGNPLEVSVGEVSEPETINKISGIRRF